MTEEFLQKFTTLVTGDN